jgi:hypothetical protein
MCSLTVECVLFLRTAPRARRAPNSWARSTTWACVAPPAPWTSCADTRSCWREGRPRTLRCPVPTPATGGQRGAGSNPCPSAVYSAEPDRRRQETLYLSARRKRALPASALRRTLGRGALSAAAPSPREHYRPLLCAALLAALPSPTDVRPNLCAT